MSLKTANDIVNATLQPPREGVWTALAGSDRIPAAPRPELPCWATATDRAASRDAQLVRTGSASAWGPGTGASGPRATLKKCWQPTLPPVGGAFVSPSTSGFRSWTAFWGLIAEFEYFNVAASDTDMIKVLLELVAWYVSEGNQAGTFAGKL